MRGRVSGVFPGGPSRRNAGAPGVQAPIRSVGDRTAAERGQRLARERARRRRRRLVGALLAFLAAGAGGYLAGRRGAGDPRAAARENAAAAAVDRAISREVNRVLLELWKMEGTDGSGLPPRIP